MSSYIGKVSIDSGTPVLVGSTLYGVCNTAPGTAAKKVVTRAQNDTTSDGYYDAGKFINSNYDQLLQGTTIHVKFVQGNTATSNLTLQVGTLQAAQDIVGTCTCPAETVLSFTLDENEKWVVNDNVDTNTEYVFKTAYNATTNKALTESDIGAAAPKDVVTDIGANTSSADLPTTAAVVSYVQNMTGGLAGLSGAMHFRGIATVAVTDDGQENPTIANYDFGTNGANCVAGDVVIWGQQEYVWTANGTAGHWELLGDEGSYALKSSTDYVTKVTGYSEGTAPTLTVTDTPVSSVSVTDGSAASLTLNPVSVPIIDSLGSAAQASVTAGVLNITLGAAPSFGTPVTFDAVGSWSANTPTSVTSTSVTVGSASGWSAGSVTTVSTSNVEVVVPNAPQPQSGS